MSQSTEQYSEIVERLDQIILLLQRLLSFEEKYEKEIKEIEESLNGVSGYGRSQ